jgi:small Trp-rich protein
MWFLVIGLGILGAHFMNIEPFVNWKWYWIVTPFILAWLWWDLIDPMFNISKRREASKFEQRKADRLAKQKEALGIGVKKKR